jgi:transposase-like protein
MAKQTLSIPALRDRIKTEADAYELLEQLRWANGIACPHCGSLAAHYFLKPANGVTRKTRTGSMSQRRVWKCKDCRKQFSVLTGTIFHGTKISIYTWLQVVFEMCASKNGVAAREIERKYELTPKSAWFMLHRIREAMKREPLAGLLRGTIISDETWYGGKPANRHGHRSGKGGQGVSDKTPIMSLVHKETGEVRSTVVANVDGKNLRPVLTEHVEMVDSVLHTDTARAYIKAGKKFSAHETVNHTEGEYVRGNVTTNHAEGFFSQLKRSLDGTQHHVSVEHLPRYLAEFDFRASTKRLSDSDRMAMLVDRTGGRRLTYRPVAD